MAELTIRPDEIRDAIERNVAAFTPETSREEVGRVVETGDGIARVEGLHSAMTNELLEFENMVAQVRKQRAVTTQQQGNQNGKEEEQDS